MKTTKLLPLTTFVAAAMSFALPAFAADATDTETNPGTHTWIGGKDGNGTEWSLKNWSGIEVEQVEHWSIGGGDGSNAWEEMDGGNSEWTQYANALFNAKGEGHTTVLVDDDIDAHNLTVTGNMEYTFEYSEGKSLTVSGNVTIGDTTDGTGQLTIESGTTTIKGTTTIADGSSLTVSGGTLTIEQQIGTSTTGDVVITGDVNIVLSGALLDSFAEAAETGGAVAVISANTITFGNVELSYSSESISDNSDFDLVVNSYISAEGYNLTWSYIDGTLYAVFVAPEPELFSIFFGLGAIGLVATRRRKRKVA